MNPTHVLGCALALLCACSTPQRPSSPNEATSSSPPLPRAVELKEPPAPPPAEIAPAPAAGPRMTQKQLSSISIKDFKALEYKSEATGMTMPYRLYIPKGYDPRYKYALILYLHGAGDRGRDNKKQFSKLVMNMARSKEQLEHPAFIIAPQCPPQAKWVNVDWHNGSYSVDATPISRAMRTAIEILDQVQREYSIDPSKVLITGVSMGGIGSWDLVARFPGRFAAIMSVCGAGDPSKASLIKDTAAWLFHGEKDKVVPTKASREMVSALQAVGASPVYIEYDNQEHGIWNEAYSDKAALKWFFSQHR